MKRPPGRPQAQDGEQPHYSQTDHRADQPAPSNPLRELRMLSVWFARSHRCPPDRDGLSRWRRHRYSRYAGVPRTHRGCRTTTPRPEATERTRSDARSPARALLPSSAAASGCRACPTSRRCTPCSMTSVVGERRSAAKGVGGKGRRRPVRRTGPARAGLRNDARQRDGEAQIDQVSSTHGDRERQPCHSQKPDQKQQPRAAADNASR